MSTKELTAIAAMGLTALAIGTALAGPWIGGCAALGVVIGLSAAGKVNRARRRPKKP